MNDVRDDALGSLLDRAAVAIEAAPSDRLPEVLRRGSRRRAARSTAIVAAVAVFVGAVSWAGLSLPSEDARIPANVGGWRTIGSLDENGWTIQVPPPWHITELPACENAPERIGLMVTNVEFEFRDPQGGPPDCEDRLLFAGFPRDGVALAFMPRGVIRGVSRYLPETTLPLSPELLIGSRGIRGGPAESSLGIFGNRAWLGMLRRYVGPEASSGDVAALDRMLASFDVRGAPGWVETVASTPRLHVAVTHPEGWDVIRFGHVTVIDAPQPIVVVRTPGVREGYSRCLGGPFGEFTTLGRFGVVVAVSDATASWGAGSFTGSRPSALRPSEARYDDVVRCSGEVRRLTFQFEEAGRPISVDVLVATSYLREVPQVLWYVLDSIRISKS